MSKKWSLFLLCIWMCLVYWAQPTAHGFAFPLTLVTRATRLTQGKLLVFWTQWKTIRLKLFKIMGSLRRCLGKIWQTLASMDKSVKVQDLDFFSQDLISWNPFRLCWLFCHFEIQSHCIWIALLQMFCQMNFWGWLSRVVGATSVHLPCKDAEVGVANTWQGPCAHEPSAVSWFDNP